MVDDGTTDGTRTVMAGLRSDRVRYIRLRRNSGKSAALSVGLDHVARRDRRADGRRRPGRPGRDRQPARRARRRASTWSPGAAPCATTASSSATRRSSTTGSRPRSPACPARTSTAAQGDAPRAGRHRWSCTASCTATSRCWPCGTASRSARSTSSTTSACHGKSKFGRARFWRGFLDLVTVKFLTTYTARPFHLFGGIGFVIGSVGTRPARVDVASKGCSGNSIGTRPALQLGVLLVVVAVQMVSLGLLGRADGQPPASAAASTPRPTATSAMTRPRRTDRAPPGTRHRPGARPRRRRRRPGRRQVRHHQPGGAAPAGGLDGQAPRRARHPHGHRASTSGWARGSPSSGCSRPAPRPSRSSTATTRPWWPTERLEAVAGGARRRRGAAVPRSPAPTWSPPSRCSSTCPPRAGGGRDGPHLPGPAGGVGAVGAVVPPRQPRPRQERERLGNDPEHVQAFTPRRLAAGPGRPLRRGAGGPGLPVAGRREARVVDR